MSSGDAWLFPIVSACVRRGGIGRRTCQRSRLIVSGRLHSLVWHVRGGHVRGQGMDQLVARLVFFGGRGGERVEGTTFPFFRVRVRADPRGDFWRLVYCVDG
jgi:hypothetical protein